jgi:hypothetical protein
MVHVFCAPYLSMTVRMIVILKQVLHVVWKAWHFTSLLQTCSKRAMKSLGFQPDSAAPLALVEVIPSS